MTLREWMRKTWHRETHVPEPIIVAPLRPRPRISEGYLPLYSYLEHRYASSVVLTFDQIEALLGFALPAAARLERDWWTGGAAHGDAWRVARRTATPNLPARYVRFERLP